MINIDSLKKELICISLEVLFINLYFVYREPRESLYLILAVYFMFKILNKDRIIYSQTRKTKRAWSKLTVIILSYTLVQMFLSLSATKVDLNIEKTYSSTDKKAILLVYQGEEKRFNLKNQTRNINEYGNLLERINTSLILNKRKKSYYQIGKSDYSKKANIVKNKLENIITRAKYEIYLGFLEDRPYIEESIREIVNKGHSEVIIVPVFIKEDKYYLSIKKTIDRMKLFNEEINVAYLDGFTEGEVLVSAYMKKIKAQVDEENKNSTGVVLIGSSDSAKEEEVLFINKIKDHLHEFLKLEENKVKKAWFRGKTSNYISEINKLLELGVSDIILIHTQPGLTRIDNNDIYNKTRKRINLPEGVKVKIIDGFLTEDEFIEEIKNKIDMLELVE